MKKIFGFYLLILLSCNLKDTPKVDEKIYFDLDGYFKKEATRLTNIKPTIKKIVSVNGQIEEKNIKIDNWEQEFSSFINADINKGSWKGSFKVSKAKHITTYTSQVNKIPINKLEIGYDSKKVISISVTLSTTNSFYTSQDSLTYFPDSLYIIKKTQHIKLMEPKNYKVIGTFIM